MNRISICLGRQLGSGGRIIGKRLSEKLAIPLYDKEILTIAAQKSGFGKTFFEKADEKASQSFIGNIYSTHVMLTDGLLGESILSNDSLFLIQSNTIKQISEQTSAIFLGRCADYILRDSPGMFSVFISASNVDRVKRICENGTVSPEEALKMIKKYDKQRAAYYNYYTNKTWGAAVSYNLCLNTSKFDIDKCVEIIAALIEDQTE